jgi:hypothetical protein
MCSFFKCTVVYVSKNEAKFLAIRLRNLSQIWRGFSGLMLKI